MLNIHFSISTQQLAGNLITTVEGAADSLTLPLKIFVVIQGGAQRHLSNCLSEV
jgi:hypothetical protein